MASPFRNSVIAAGVRAVLVACVATSALAHVAHSQVPAQVPATSVTGFVVNAQGMPLPGVTVSLVHPVLGRSTPAFTSAQGQFFFGYVPLRPEPYYIEVYWGQQLVYRNFLSVTQPVSIALPAITLR